MHLTHTGRPAVLGLALATLLASHALAVDGVIEINQAKAMAGGVTTTDSAGFPVTLDASGSYRLTGVLSVPDLNTTGIEIVADRVSIDLNGFGIAGPGGGSGSGIGISAASGKDYIVRDGFVSGMGAAGIDLLGASIVDGVSASENGGVGVTGTLLTDVSGNGNGAGLRGRVVHRCEAHANATSGISTLGGVVSDSAADWNDVGIQSLFGTVLRGNQLTFNTSRGIKVLNAGALLSQNVVTYTQDSDGIEINPQVPSLEARASLLRDNISAGNGWNSGVGVGIRVRDQASLINNAASNNATGGIVGGSHVTVIESQALANGGIGIDLDTNSLLVGNQTNDNTSKGVETGRQAVVVGGQSTNNGGHGVDVARDSLVRNNQAFGNTGEGINAGTSATIIGNNTNENTNNGIFTSNASHVASNAAGKNGTGSAGSGIWAGEGSNVLGNAAWNNQEHGLEAETTGVGFSNNVLGDNSVSDADSGTDLGENMCGGTAGC